MKFSSLLVAFFQACILDISLQKSTAIKAIVFFWIEGDSFLFFDEKIDIGLLNIGVQKKGNPAGSPL